MEIVENQERVLSLDERRRLDEAEKEKQITPVEIIREYSKVKDPEPNPNSRVNFYDCFHFHCYAGARKKIVQWGFDKCVIAYLKNCLGAIFIVKSSRAYWAFSIRRCELFGYSNVLWEINELSDVIKFLDANNGVILNKPEYEKMKKTFLAKAICKGNGGGNYDYA